MTRQKKNLKTVSVQYKNTDLILKMIKMAKISRVRVSLSDTEFFNLHIVQPGPEEAFHQLFLYKDFLIK
jgi:hypothetical protein